MRFQTDLRCSDTWCKVSLLFRLGFFLFFITAPIAVGTIEHIQNAAIFLPVGGATLEVGAIHVTRIKYIAKTLLRTEMRFVFMKPPGSLTAIGKTPLQNRPTFEQTVAADQKVADTQAAAAAVNTAVGKPYDL